MARDPVFQTKQEVEDWKKLCADSWKSEDQLADFLNNVLKTNSVRSEILVECMWSAAQHKVAGRRELIEKLAMKSRPNDCMPKLTAASIFTDMGDRDTAEKLISQVKGGNIPYMCCVRAKLRIAQGDNTSARKELTRARCSNATFPMFYDLIQRIDPEGGWAYRRNIELIVSGQEPIPFGDSSTDTGPKALYSIYSDWYGGRREEATRKMVESDEYRNKNSEYLLASARMSMDEKDWHSAQMMYVSLLEKRQNCVYLICEAADSFFRGGDSDRALSYYREAEALDSLSPIVVRGLVRAYGKLGMKDEAAQCMWGLLDSEAAGLTEYKEAAAMFYDWKMYNDASKVAARIVITYPEDRDAGMLGSRIEMEKGDLNAALDTAGTVMRNHPKDVGARVQYARVLFMMGKPDRAEKEVEKAEKLDRDNIEALLLLKDIYLDAGNSAKAKDVCKRILAKYPDNKEAAEAMSQASAMVGRKIQPEIPKTEKDQDRGEEMLIRAIGSLILSENYLEAAEMCRANEKKYPNSAMLKRLRGNVEYAMGEYLKASASFASALATDSGNGGLWHSKGLADEKLGDIDSAAEAFTKALLADPENDEFWISRASVLEKKGELSEAVDALNKAIYCNPRSSDAVARKAVLFAKMKKHNEAQSLIQMVRATGGDDARLRKAEMDIYMEAGMVDRAFALATEIMAKDAADPDAVAFAVDCEIKAGRQERVFLMIERALSQKPDSSAILRIGRDAEIAIGNMEVAVKYAERLVEVVPNDLIAKKELADLYAKRGDMNSANKIYAALSVGGERRADATDKAKSAAESESACEIAKSLMAVGDFQGAARTADRRLAADGRDMKMILIRAEIYVASGDLRSGDAFLSDMIKKIGPYSDICEADGDIRSKMGDAPGALARYDAVITSGKPTSDLYVKRGLIQESMGSFDAAASSYVSAVIKDPKNIEAHRRMAACQLKIGNLQAAEKSIDTAYVSDRSAATLAIRAEVFAKSKNRDEVLSTYKAYLRTGDSSQPLKDIMMKALADVGLKDDAAELNSLVESEKREWRSDVPAKIKRVAERILRRAYTSDMMINDPDLLNSLDIDRETADAVVEYISDIPEFGDIHPGTPVFERLELLSMNAITKGNCKGLDEDPVITISCAFVAGGTKDADEAKVLVSYIYKVMSSKTDRRVLDDKKFENHGANKNTPVEEIVKGLHTGIYRAKALKDTL